MKFKKIIPIIIFLSLSTMFISSCNSNEVNITYRLVRVVDGIDILSEKGYSFTVVFEKNHEYNYDDHTLVYRQMLTYYYNSGASRLTNKSMEFDKLYYYENKFSTDEGLLLKLGDMFTKNAIYVCYSDYTPTNSDQSSSI